MMERLRHDEPARVLRVAAGLAHDAHLGVRVVLPPDDGAAPLAREAAEEAGVNVDVDASEERLTIRFGPSDTQTHSDDPA